MNLPTKKIPFDIYLPATVNAPPKFVETIEVEVYENFGEEFLTAESSELIERTRAHHMGYLHGKDIRDLRKRIKSDTHPDCPYEWARESRERTIAIMKLQEAIMWLGMDLKAINEETPSPDTASPYPSSYDPESTTIEPTAVDWADFARRLESERDEALAYADKLAAGLPEGMLPKDVEVLRDANLALAVERDALQEQLDAAIMLGKMQERRHERDFEELIAAAKAVIDRWDTPFWKEAAHTGAYIAALRKAVEIASRLETWPNDPEPFESPDHDNDSETYKEEL